MRSDMNSSAHQRRLWRKGDRAKTSILQIFRNAHAQDSAHIQRPQNDEDGRALSTARQQRRDGVSETQLRAHIEADLISLLNTIRLDAATPLEDAPHVARSILNYGFRDLSSVGANELNTPAVVQSIRNSLIDHEPRLVPETIEVTVREAQDARSQRLSIVVQAEMMGDPLDIPLSFDADVDLGAGKLKMSKLQVQM